MNKKKTLTRAPLPSQTAGTRAAQWAARARARSGRPGAPPWDPCRPKRRAGRLANSKATGSVASLHECHRVATASTPSANVTILSSRDMAYGCILHNSVIHQGRSIIAAAYYNIDIFSDKNCSVYDVCICSKLHHGDCHAPNIANMV